jgi:hypothetical protein
LAINILKPTKNRKSRHSAHCGERQNTTEAGKGNSARKLACILHEGNEYQGKFGKQGWAIALDA